MKERRREKGREEEEEEEEKGMETRILYGNYGFVWIYDFKYGFVWIAMAFVWRIVGSIF